MSRLFSYSKIKDTVNFDGMLPGQKSRVSDIDVQFAGLIKPSTNVEYVENGEVVGLVRVQDEKINVMTVVDSKSDLYATASKGVVLADVKGAFERLAGPNYIYKHAKETTVTVMTQGYVWVPVQDDGTILANTKVYVKDGGVYTSSSDGAVELPNAKFTGLNGYPLTSKQNGTSSGKLTGRTAEICLGVSLL